MNYFKKFFGVAAPFSIPDPVKEKEPTLSGTDDGLPPSARPLNTHKTVDKDGGAYSRRVAPMRLVLRCMCARIVLLP